MRPKENKEAAFAQSSAATKAATYKTPTQTSRNQPKLLVLLVFAQDKQPALPLTNNSAKICTKHTKLQQNPQKITPKKEGCPLYSTQTGQSQGHLAAVAVASPAAVIRQSAPKNKSGPPHLRAAKTPGMAAGR